MYDIDKTQKLANIQKTILKLLKNWEKSFYYKICQIFVNNVVLSLLDFPNFKIYPRINYLKFFKNTKIFELIILILHNVLSSTYYL